MADIELPSTLNDSYVKQWVAAQLGSSGRAVELEDTDYIQVIHNSLRRLNSVRGRESSRVLPGEITSEMGESTSLMYDIDSDVVDILSVEFLVPDGEALATRDVFSLDRYNYYYTRGRTYDITLQRMFRETYLRQRGMLPEWEFDREGHKLHISASSGPYMVSLIEVRRFTKVSEIPYDLQEIFLKINLRYAKETLGRIRSKFGDSISGPSGEIRTDGSVLIAESNSMETELREELPKLRRTPPPLWF